jgi:hypothetical protein
MFTLSEKLEIKYLKNSIKDIKRYAHRYPREEIKKKLREQNEKIREIKENAYKRVW